MSYAPVVQHPALTCAVLFSCSELKIMQKVITLAVFVPFAVVYMGQPLKSDYLWAGMCLTGAVYFMFRT